MAKSICITAKKGVKVRDINPETKKARSIGDVQAFNSTAKISFQNRRFVDPKKVPKVQSQKLATSPKSVFWGSAADIDI